METQYFGDKRDFRKYELLLDLVEGLPGPRQLTALLMLTDAVRTGRRDVRLLRPFLRDMGV